MSWLRCCLASLGLLVVCCSQDFSMPQCQNGTLQIRETQPQTPIRCEGLTLYDNMNWMITHNNGTSHLIASCRDGLNIYKCSVYDADFFASRNETVSQLVMENYVRDKVVNKTLTCIRRDRARKDSCRIRSVYPAVISRHSVTLIGWTLTATAVIHKVFDSDSNVVCLWVITGPNSIYFSEMERPQLSAFSESSRVYYSGSCSLSLPVDVTEGVYHVTVTVLPAGGPVAVGNVTLNQPATPGDKEVPLAFIVGGSVAAVVVVIVFIVVMLVIVVKRKSRTYERPRRRRGRPEHTYSDLHPDNNTTPQPLNTASATPRNTAHNAAFNTDHNTAHNAAHNAAHNTAHNAAHNTAHYAADNTAFNTAPNTETGRVYVNTRGDGASGGAVYYNDTSDTQTAPSTDAQDAVYYNDTSDTQTAPSNNAQDADHYYTEILPPVDLNGPAALTREADPGMNVSLYEEIK